MHESYPLHLDRDAKADALADALAPEFPTDAGRVARSLMNVFQVEVDLYDLNPIWEADRRPAQRITLIQRNPTPKD